VHNKQAAKAREAATKGAEDGNKENRPNR
jgi:hypothetical protein